MGQGTSIIEYDYNNMNRLLGNAPQLLKGEWKRNFTPTEATYWKTGNSKIKAGIRADEWPLKQPSDEHFTFGHHYFYVTSNGTEYHYDADNDNWVADQPDEPLNQFIEQWKELLTSAEEVAGETTTVVTQRGEIKHSRNTRNQMDQRSRNVQNAPIRGQQLGGGHDMEDLKNQISILIQRIDKLEKEHHQLMQNQTQK